MTFIHLGRTGIQVFRLCLGTTNFGLRTLKEEAPAIMDLALHAELGGELTRWASPLIRRLTRASSTVRQGRREWPRGASARPWPQVDLHLC